MSNMEKGGWDGRRLLCCFFSTFVYLFMHDVMFQSYHVPELKRPLVDSLGASSAPPPLSDQQRAWWYNTLPKNLHTEAKWPIVN